MKLYIDPQPNESGAYPNPKGQPFPGCIELDDQQSTMFLAHNGFVSIAEQVDGPVIVTPNTKAWEAWKAAEACKPPMEPVPTPEEKLAALEQENKLLSAQVAALSDQNDFQEELIVEMAGVVYA